MIEVVANCSLAPLGAKPNRRRKIDDAVRPLLTWDARPALRVGFPVRPLVQRRISRQKFSFRTGPAVKVAGTNSKHCFDVLHCICECFERCGQHDQFGRSLLLSPKATVKALFAWTLPSDF